MAEFDEPRPFGHTGVFIQENSRNGSTGDPENAFGDIITEE